MYLPVRVLSIACAMNTPNYYIELMVLDLCRALPCSIITVFVSVFVSVSIVSC